MISTTRSTTGERYGRYAKHVPQLRAVTTTQLEVGDGHAIAPPEPGLGIDWDWDAHDAHRVA